MAANAAAADDLAPTGQVLLVVEDLSRARVLHVERVMPGAVLVLSYVHSSEHVPVLGTFVVQPDGTLRVKETAFAGFGPGLPEPKAGDAWRREGEMIVVEGGGERLAELRVRVAPFTRHRLRMPSGMEVDVSTSRPGGGAIRISVRDRPRAAADRPGRRP